jgi:hypothetical protein
MSFEQLCSTRTIKQDCYPNPQKEISGMSSELYMRIILSTKKKGVTFSRKLISLVSVAIRFVG